MKKHYKKPKAVKALAAEFEHDLNRVLPITVQVDGSLVYKDYLVKENKVGNWIVYHIPGKTPVGEFYLKTCALMAAKAYSKTDINKFFEIKRIDDKYWANRSDLAVYTKNIKLAKDFDRYLILLNKLEHSKDLTTFYKEKISTMFTWSFA